MRSLIAFFVVTFSYAALSLGICDVTGQYRCKSGKTGNVQGRGATVEAAKLVARDRARDLCMGMVDYVRFVENPNCNSVASLDR